MSDLEPLLRFWRALDGRFGGVHPTPWGSVVTDARFPAIWDVNYARLEADHPIALSEVERSLLPALRRARAPRIHIVAFHPEVQTDLVTEASTRGDRLSWDSIMVLRRPVDRGSTVAVEEIAGFDERFWRDVAGSMAEFDVTEADAVDQILRIEREILGPAGKRWFSVRSGHRSVALGCLLVLEGVGLVDHVVTLPRFRGRGYASAIVGRIVQEARTSDVEALWLLCEPDSRAEALYRRLGFVTTRKIVSTLGDASLTAGA